MDFTYKIVLDTRREKKDGTYPIKLRVYKGADYDQLSINFSVKKENWDEGTQEVINHL